MDEKKKNPAGSFFWQVIFPTTLGVLLVAFLGVWVVLEVSPGNISRFAEISTVLLVIPYLGGSLLGGLFLAALVALTIKIINGVPTITGKILDILEQIRIYIKKVSEFAVAPVIRPAGFLAGLKRIFARDDSEIQID